MTLGAPPDIDPEATRQIQESRLRAGRLSLVVGILIFAGKFAAYSMTGSTAVFADALESTINIVSAGMLLFALALAAKPPDRDHPYGHGRVEFLSAAIEGAAITVAALIILSESLRELIQGPEITRIDTGLIVLVVCTVANLLLGRHLVKTGESTESIALVADGRHIMSDVWTSAGVIGGLLVVRATGFVWADPLVAIAVALNVAREGFELLRVAVRGLMDEADDETLEWGATALEDARQSTWIDVHSLRSWRSGARRHFDLHVAVPRYFDVEQVHTIHDGVEEALVGRDAHGGDVVIHFDPCDDSLCVACSVEPCPIRKSAFVGLLPLTLDRVVQPDEDVRKEDVEEALEPANGI